MKLTLTLLAALLLAPLVALQAADAGKRLDSQQACKSKLQTTLNRHLNQLLNSAAD